MNLLQVTGVYNNTSYPCKIRTGILAGSYTPSLWESHQDPGDILAPEIFTWNPGEDNFSQWAPVEDRILGGILAGICGGIFPAPDPAEKTTYLGRDKVPGFLAGSCQDPGSYFTRVISY